MSNTNNTVRSINAAAKRKFKEAAKHIPIEIAEELEARAIEGVTSGEPHKATGGWVASPFYGKHDICGLLEIASKAIRSAQMAAFNSATV